ncbi:MAG: cobyric acid synthase [Clostridiales bacterium]|nr:cobyric acid synthase [Clostridiales bacterium]
MAKAIMIQGTMSNVGKSLIAGAFCRIFVQDGYKCAPFKSQNMALNSYITLDGREMGRAQVMQAEAAGIEPDAAMNPILLKPTNDIGSQVIVMGRPIGNMRAIEYYKRKREFIPYIMEAYEKLASENDIIVIEGAGSPAEINLKENDIVNMGLAKLVHSPVLLVGDIDRGGVFAQLLGTMELLENDEQNLVKGIIINKFRGDKEILKPGLEMLESRCHRPIMGVVPYVNVDIDDEDSLSTRFDRHNKTGIIDIAVIRLGRISNFTDFMALECIDGIDVRYVSDRADLGEPDMVIIPGTKNTVGDLLAIRENGLESRIKQLAAKGTLVFGICGGFQMLGETITDISGAEAEGEYAGMGLIPINTVFEEEKISERTKGTIGQLDGMLSILSGQPFEGYEIHMGRSGRDINSVVQGINNVYGTYIHGIFDNRNVTDIIINAIMDKKGLSEDSVRAIDMKEYKERQYDTLADTVRNNIDMDEVYDIIEKGVEI